MSTLNRDARIAGPLYLVFAIVGRSASPILFGEVAFMLWLLIMGARLNSNKGALAAGLRNA